MDVVVLKVFRDKYDTAKLYAPGMIVNVDKARANDLVLRGLAALVDKPAQPPAQPPLMPAGYGSTGLGSTGSQSGLEPAANAPAGNVPPAPVTKIDLTQRYLSVVSDVKSFTDAEKLKAALAAENGSVKPRTSVVDAITARIAELENGKV
jgi:hypothetical protein